MITRTGGCHCGAVKFEVDCPDEPKIYACNCSICRPLAFLHLIVPAPAFRLVQGSEALSTYTFGTGVAQHRFCSICGVKSFYVPRSHPDGFSVNARCVDGVDLETVKIIPFDGENWEASSGGLPSL